MKITLHYSARQPSLIPAKGRLIGDFYNNSVCISDEFRFNGGVGAREGPLPLRERMRQRSLQDVNAREELRGYGLELIPFASDPGLQQLGTLRVKGV